MSDNHLLTRADITRLYAWAVECKDASAPSDRAAGLFFIECRRCGYGKHVPAAGIDPAEIDDHLAFCIPAHAQLYLALGVFGIEPDTRMAEMHDEQRFRPDEDAEARRLGFN